MKKKYSRPTVTRIALNYQQAVLAACSSTGTKKQQPGSVAECQARGCRGFNKAGAGDVQQSS